MKTPHPTPPGETGPAPIDPRWRELLKSAYFQAPEGMPPSAWQRQRLVPDPAAAAAAAAEEERLRQKFQGTTPQGREIIRKKLYELKKQVRAREVERPLEILRRLVPNFRELVAARPGSAATWKTCCDAAVAALVGAGSAAAFRAAEQELSAMVAQPGRPSLGMEQKGEADFWHALAAEVTQRLTGPLG
jgi:hypothetical protein